MGAKPTENPEPTLAWAGLAIRRLRYHLVCISESKTDAHLVVGVVYDRVVCRYFWFQLVAVRKLTSLF